MATSEKTTIAYTPPAPAPPAYSPDPTPQGSTSTPSNIQQQPSQVPAPKTKPLSAAEKGEQYRSQLYARCAAGKHQPKTSYGMCGIITAIVCFPCGLICLCVDSEQKCERCGVKLS